MSQNFERLGNYILLEKINAGGMAEVYLSKSIGANGINKFLAIKRILPQFADNREFIEMFKEEAKIAVNINHNNVVSIIDFKASQNQLYLVMEFVQGQNLRQILQQKKKKGLALSLDFIIYIIREVAAGIDYAHRCVDKGTGKPLNIIHRDMSPQNIMISYDGEVKVVDFGIAKAEATGEATRVGTLKGKFSYMSPEQAEGLVVDQGSDIFSLGIILWELIADDRLFVANNEMNILKRIKECDVPELRRVNPTVPAELERIVKKALMKDKSLRYHTTAELHKDLTRFLNKEYPDFTPGDFSTFMKFLFENEYSLAQERMVNYARLDFGSLSELSEATQFTKSTLVTNPMGGFQPPPQPQQSNFDPPENFDLNQMNPPKLNQSLFSEKKSTQGVEISAQTKQSTMTGLSLNTSIKTRVGQVGQNTKIRNGGTQSSLTFATRSGVTSTGIRYRAPAKPPTSEFAKTIFVFIFLSLFLAAGYFVSPKKVKAKINKQSLAILNILLHKSENATIDKTKETNPLAGAKTENGDESFSSTGTINVLVKSTPGRAKIYINSKSTGLSTPASVELPVNASATLTLLADGHLEHVEKITPSKNGQEINVTLTPVSFGYLDINVYNGGIETKIFIDDVELNDKPPFLKYPVRSGKPIKIKALHPFSGGTAETTVTVGVNEKKSVDLILSSPTKGKAEKAK